MIAGILILYNPQKNFINNIKTYINNLETLYIIDNSLKENAISMEEIKLKKIIYIKNKKNLGIAKALNLGIKEILKNKKIKYILTMDQDSSFKDDQFKDFYEQVLKEKDEKIVIYSPIHTMKNKILSDKNKVVMTSGNILKIKNLKTVGLFCEDFFIDEVDHEFCYRIYEKGFNIKVFKNIFLEHQLGERKKSNIILGTNHNSIRRYYITRNKLYMIKKYPFLKNRYLFHLTLSFIRILFFETEKNQKIKFFIKGIKDYLKQKKGALN